MCSIVSSGPLTSIGVVDIRGGEQTADGAAWQLQQTDKSAGRADPNEKIARLTENWVKMGRRDAVMLEKLSKRSSLGALQAIRSGCVEGF